MPLPFFAFTQAYMRSGSLGETVGPMRPMPSVAPGNPLVSCRQLLPPSLDL